MKCYEKINVEERQEEFRKFWELADYTAQNAHITSCVREQPVKRHYATTGRFRQYYIKAIQVCRTMFAAHFRISTKRVNTALVKLRSSSLLDKGGKHDNHKKIKNEIRESIKERIENLPKYESHYCRESVSGNRQCTCLHN